MIEINDMNCCALKEISGLSYYPREPEESLKEVYTDWTGNFQFPIKGHSSALIFTQAYPRRGIRRGYGDLFAALIQKHSLGEVTTVDVGKNPNSGQYVKMFVWKVDWKALRKYGQTKKWEGDTFQAA